MDIFLSPFARENLVSRDGFGSPVPRQSAYLHTQAECGAYLRNSSRVPRQPPFIYLNRHTPSDQSRVYWVTQLRTGGVHCLESTGTGSVNLKVVPNGCCLGRSRCASLSHTHYWYEVGMLKVPSLVPWVESGGGRSQGGRKEVNDHVVPGIAASWVVMN